MKAIIVGAGLTCAKALREGGVEPNLLLAGEYTEDSSINGSMLSGERTAREVLG
jgi:hypothetical protein